MVEIFHHLFGLKREDEEEQRLIAEFDRAMDTVAKGRSHYLKKKMGKSSKTLHSYP